jgi:hypothetical protein
MAPEGHEREKLEAGRGTQLAVWGAHNVIGNVEKATWAHIIMRLSLICCSGVMVVPMMEPVMVPVVPMVPAHGAGRLLWRIKVVHLLVRGGEARLRQMQLWRPPLLRGS